MACDGGAIVMRSAVLDGKGTAQSRLPNKKHHRKDGVHIGHGQRGNRKQRQDTTLKVDGVTSASMAWKGLPLRHAGHDDLRNAPIGEAEDRDDQSTATTGEPEPEQQPQQPPSPHASRLASGFEEGSEVGDFVLVCKNTFLHVCWPAQQFVNRASSLPRSMRIAGADRAAVPHELASAFAPLTGTEFLEAQKKLAYTTPVFLPSKSPHKGFDAAAAADRTAVVRNLRDKAAAATARSKSMPAFAKELVVPKKPTSQPRLCDMDLCQLCNLLQCRHLQKCNVGRCCNYCHCWVTQSAPGARHRNTPGKVDTTDKYSLWLASLGCSAADVYDVWPKLDKTARALLFAKGFAKQVRSVKELADALKKELRPRTTPEQVRSVAALEDLRKVLPGLIATAQMARNLDVDGQAELRMMAH